MQDLGPDDVSALCAACHELSQLGAPLIVVGAGLPHLPAVLSAAKSYSERLFRYQRIDRLDRIAADQALCAPAEREEVEYEQKALDLLYEKSGGYPYFVQAYGKATWDHAPRSPITAADVRVAAPEAEGELAVGFFGSRFERATPAEREYMRAMATLSARRPRPTTWTRPCPPRRSPGRWTQAGQPVPGPRRADQEGARSTPASAARSPSRSRTSAATCAPSRYRPCPRASGSARRRRGRRPTRVEGQRLPVLARPTRHWSSVVVGREAEAAVVGRLAEHQHQRSRRSPGRRPAPPARPRCRDRCPAPPAARPPARARAPAPRPAPTVTRLSSACATTSPSCSPTIDSAGSQASDCAQVVDQARLGRPAGSSGGGERRGHARRGSPARRPAPLGVLGSRSRTSNVVDLSHSFAGISSAKRV